jgi:ferritin
MTSIIAEARSLQAVLEQEEFVSVDRVSELAKRARSCADLVDPEAQQRIMTALNELFDTVKRHQSRTTKKINQLRSNRRSIKKFAHLRGHSKGQRYYNSM